MNGVQILNAEPIYANMLPGWLLRIFAVMAVILGLTVLILGSVGEWKPAIVCFIGFLVFIVWLIFGGQHRPEPEYTKYEVTIDDSVSFNEFYNQYELLEQRGEIYVVREKTE